MAISHMEVTKAAERMGCTSRFISVLNRVAFEQNLAEGKGANHMDPGGRTSQEEGPASAEAGGGSKLGEFRGKQRRSSRWDQRRDRKYQLRGASQDTVRMLALTQSERETSRGQCRGNTTSGSNDCAADTQQGEGKGRETIHCPSESWWYWDRRGSREVVTCLDSGQTVKVDPVGIANGLDVGCEGKRGVPPGHLAQETAKRKFIVSHLLIKGELHV